MTVQMANILAVGKGAIALGGHLDARVVDEGVPRSAAQDRDGLCQLGNEEMHCVAGGKGDEANVVGIEAHEERGAHEEELDLGVDDGVVKERWVEVRAAINKIDCGRLVADKVGTACGAREGPRHWWVGGE